MRKRRAAFFLLGCVLSVEGEGNRVEGGQVRRVLVLGMV